MSDITEVLATALAGRMPSSGHYADARRLVKALGLTLEPIHAHPCPAWRNGKSFGPCNCSPTRFQILGVVRALDEDREVSS